MELRGRRPLAGATDETLAFLVREGDAAATEVLVTRYFPDGQRIALEVMGDKSDGGWITVLTVHRCVVSGRFDPNIGPLRPFLCTAMRNEARNLRRFRGRRPAESLDQLLARDPSAESRLLGQRLDAAPLADLFEEDLEALAIRWERAPTWSVQKRRWARVLRLLMEGHSVESVARELAMKPKAVQNVLYRNIRPALRSMREQ